MKFFVGMHRPNNCDKVTRAFVSVNVLKKRRSAFCVGEWIMDSGAFTEVSAHGRYRQSVKEYAAEIRRWAGNGELLAASAQDWMCEDVVLKRAAIAEGSLPAPEWFDHSNRLAFRKLHRVPWLYPAQRDEQLLAHQTRTIERYDALKAEDVGGVYILPVLQGFTPAEYVKHIEMYGDRLGPGAWVGVGSICKRNTDMQQIEDVLLAIKARHSDLRLHGFGLKKTALESARVRECLHTADSMSWSYAERMNGGDANDWRAAKSFELEIANQRTHRKPRQLVFL